MRKIYLLAMMMALVGLEGCSTFSSSLAGGTAGYGHELTKNDSGILYGPLLKLPASDNTVKSACDAIQNADKRCARQDDYVLGVINPQRKALAMAKILVLIPKDKQIQPCDGIESGGCTFLKMQAEKGALGRVIEVASVPGDKKCYWMGGAGVGHTVCPAYGWDADKDLRDFDSTLGGAITGVYGK